MGGNKKETESFILFEKIEIPRSLTKIYCQKIEIKKPEILCFQFFIFYLVNMLTFSGVITLSKIIAKKHELFNKCRIIR